MPLVRSPEIEAVVRRVLVAWNDGDADTIANLFSTDPGLRVLGFDHDERWAGHDEFLKLFRRQAVEMVGWTLDIDHVEGFEDDGVGWVIAHTTMTTQATRTPLRHMASLRIESGVWRVVQWQNSIPVPNEQIFGVPLTTTLDELMASLVDDDVRLEAVAGSEGTLTLVFTDVVDSTGLAASVGDAAYAELMTSHEVAIRRVAASHGGSVVKVLGDGAMLAFESARASVRAAVEIRRSSLAAGLPVRIGIHTGEVVRAGDDFLGITVNKAARVAASADADEIMLSATTRDLVGSMSGLRYGEPRMVALKGLAGVDQIVPVEIGAD